LESAPSTTTAPVLHAPNDFQMMGYWAKLAAYRFKHRIDDQRVDEWNVGLVRAPVHRFLEPDYEPTVEWTGYRQYGQMVADPFLVPGTSAAAPRLLAEELAWLPNRGRIVELSAQEGEAGVRPVLDKGVHMSYPFVFEADGEVYLMPECVASRSVRAYRYDPATGATAPAHVLLEDVDAVDSTLHFDGTRWWLFHSGSEGAAAYSLFLWSAPHWKGPWTPHAANPVKTDASSARPGGSLFVHDGQLYRPAQDGRHHYGAGLAICRVDELGEEAYRETVVRRWSPRRLLLERKLRSLLGRPADGFRYTAKAKPRG
jgi:hypothetical protein